MSAAGIEQAVERGDPFWLKEWLEGRLRFEDLTLEQRTYVLKRYKGEPCESSKEL